MVKEHGSNVVQMAIERKETSSALVGPNLDLVVIAPRHEQRLRFVEVYASDRPVMLFETVYQSAHAVIP
jgi:hypothetical protein